MGKCRIVERGKHVYLVGKFNVKQLGKALQHINVGIDEYTKIRRKRDEQVLSVGTVWMPKKLLKSRAKEIKKEMRC